MEENFMWSSGIKNKLQHCNSKGYGFYTTCVQEGKLFKLWSSCY